jgi:hypothetical protein
VPTKVCGVFLGLSIFLAVGFLKELIDHSRRQGARSRGDRTSS